MANSELCSITLALMLIVNVGGFCPKVTTPPLNESKLAGRWYQVMRSNFNPSETCHTIDISFFRENMSKLA